MSNEIIQNLEDLPEGGALLYEGSRYLLLPPESLAEFQRAMEVELDAERVGQAVYRIAQRHGQILAHYFRSSMSLPDDEAMRFLTRLIRQMGWGRPEIINLSIGHSALELEVYHSAFAEGYLKADHPVCHWLRGFYAGIMRIICGTEVEGLETRCRAVEGPGPCAFVFAATSGSGFSITSNPFKVLE